MRKSRLDSGAPMQTVQRIPFSQRIKWYITLTKPGILMGNAITAMGGFALASKGSFDLLLFLSMLVGINLIMASGCVLNNYIDRDMDKKMARTQHRPSAMGIISVGELVGLASALCIAGLTLLWGMTNLLTSFIAITGLVVYVAWYSFLKYRTRHATLIGSIAGAIPPLVGYCAVTSRFDGIACFLFLMMVLWQMPHFFAIAIFRAHDYEAASIPVLPAIRGIFHTKVQIAAYILAFMGLTLGMSLLGYTSITFAIATQLLGGAWLALAVWGFVRKDHTSWARSVFRFSLIVITLINAILPF